MSNEIVEKVKKLRERQAAVESRRVQLQTRLDVKITELDRLKDESREKFRVEIEDLPALVARQEVEISQGIAALDAALADVDAKLRSVEIS